MAVAVLVGCYEPMPAYDPGTAATTSSGGVRGGPVHVNGYYRSNGTYVHSYTRSAPSHGGGRR